MSLCVFTAMHALHVAQVLVGVTWPVENKGYWLGPAQSSTVTGKHCDSLRKSMLHPTTGVQVCQLGQSPIVRVAGIECVAILGVDPEVMFACSTGLQVRGKAGGGWRAAEL